MKNSKDELLNSFKRMKADQLKSVTGGWGSVSHSMNDDGSVRIDTDYRTNNDSAPGGWESDCEVDIDGF